MIRIKPVLFVALILLICLATASISPVTAERTGPISVSDSEAVLIFPRQLTFSARIQSRAEVTDVRLRYQVEQMSYADIFSEGFVELVPAPDVDVEYQLDMRRFGGFPPGTVLQYWWAVRDAEGNYLETDKTTFTIVDNRYSWDKMEEGKIVLYWYEGGQTFAEALMLAAQNALIKLAAETGASPQKPVSIYIYASSDDLQGSMIFPSEWTGGVSYFNYNIITLGVHSTNLDWGLTAMTHELTHNVIGQVVFNPYADMPVWLNEGLAMYYQGELTSQFTQPLASASRNDSLISVRTISSPFSAYADKANLSYAESYTLYDYLLTTYGPQKIAALLQVFKTGSTYDGAFKEVMGIDLDQLNDAWEPWVKEQYGK